MYFSVLSGFFLSVSDVIFVSSPNSENIRLCILFLKPSLFKPALVGRYLGSTSIVS